MEMIRDALRHRSADTTPATHATGKMFEGLDHHSRASRPAQLNRRVGGAFRERREGRVDAGRLKVMADIEAPYRRFQRPHVRLLRVRARGSAL